MNEKYMQAIVEEYNRWKAKYNETLNGNIAENGVAAFMCNAISTAMRTSSNEEARSYFLENAERE